MIYELDTVPDGPAASPEFDGYSVVNGAGLIGPDGTPVTEPHAATADRMARLADEVAALVNQVAAALTWQETALSTVAATTPEGRIRLAAARTVATRSVRALMHVVVDALGEVHVTGDQLAHDLATDAAAAAPAAGGGA